MGRGDKIFFFPLLLCGLCFCLLNHVYLDPWPFSNIFSSPPPAILLRRRVTVQLSGQVVSSLPHLLTIYIVNNGYQTDLMSQITGSSTAGNEFCVSCMLSLQKQRNQNAQENDESVFCYKQYFSSVECKDSESLCLRAQLEALITSMGQKVSSSFEFCLRVTGQYQTLVPGFWASLITCLQVSNRPVSLSVTMTTSLLSASWTFHLCCSHLETHPSILNNMEIIETYRKANAGREFLFSHLLAAPEKQVTVGNPGMSMGTVCAWKTELLTWLSPWM